MDELDRLALEFRQYIEERFTDHPELRDLHLRVIEQEIDRVRREDAPAAAT